MPKRRASESLTGGTGDVNPQWMRFHIGQAAADTATELAIPLPQIRYPQAQGRSVVIEILKVQIDSTPVYSTAAGTYTLFAGVAVRQTPVPVAGITGYQVWKTSTSWIQYLERSSVTIGAPATLTQSVAQDPIEFDLTDGAGHGMLVATDTLYAYIISAAGNTGNTSTGVANHAEYHILYRMKEVSLQEYIGIVQAQQ